MEDIMNLLVGGDDTVDVLAESLKADRKLILNGEVDSWCVEEICMQIMKWNQDDKDIMPEKRKKIYLLINTPGGDAFLFRDACCDDWLWHVLLDGLLPPLCGERKILLPQHDCSAARRVQFHPDYQPQRQGHPGFL